ncbi:hypothetical protein P280DRAFT_400311 [Massarina eburnea CBS 473.64]|uniref:YAG7-like dimerisation domain-containing protein n=1 Tax=Massarina eburnea CBS 473.64 TaxID=1395130 RepID=A0A6A6S012_9PLEO|nr:hypothetical protein P280DRAFT_400311 [Massarina eburnea CBS 473.64]
MSADAVANPPATTPGESKSARKKKAKAEAAATAVPAPAEKNTSEFGANGSDSVGKANGADENSYIRELQKNVRNVNKKLNAMTKVNQVVGENPGVSVDELVSSRKINADQKAQLQKKPFLQAQLAQYEEQLSQYKKFEQEYETKISQEKEILQKGHSEELEKLRDTIKAEAVLEQKRAFREKFLTLSRFLRAAAARRQLEEDDSDLTKAFEGALLLVYGGDASAVAATEKLIDGTSDPVPSTEGILLNITYAQIKQAALEEAPFAAEEAWAENVAESQPADPETAATDPTIANAGLTELDTTTLVNGGSETAGDNGIPAASSIDAGAANAAGGDWEKAQPGSDDPLTESFEMVPRPLEETETPAAAPAAVNSTRSWADEPVEAQTAPANAHDGFQEVQSNRGGRGRGGQHQGGEGRGGYRGRGGPRGGRGGRGRGRGDGGFRGGPRGGFRGGPRGGDSQ